jgi:hypothetical protein
MVTQRNSWMFVDCQGLKSCGTAGTDVLFEVSWKVLSGAGETDDFEVDGMTTLVRPPVILSRRSLMRITQLCGIRPVELAKAPDAGDVAELFARAVEHHQPDAIVIHYAAFERPFIANLWELARPGAEFPVPLICTRDLSRKQMPELNSYSLKAVAGYFGTPCDEMKRALSHVDATIAVWRGLRDMELDGGRPGKELRALRLALPDVPGTYRFFDARGRILYVGKATSLHHRVNSYFRGGVRNDSRKREMMAQVKHIEVREAPSPLHAALDEFRGIVEMSPPYNIAMKKDDRPVVWLDRVSLLPLSIKGMTPNVRALGPFATDMVFADLRAIAALCRGEAPEKPLEFLFPGIDPECAALREGFAGAIDLLGLTSDASRRPGAWLSRAVWRFLAGKDRDEDLEDPRGESRDELPWDAGCVTRSILRKLKRAAIKWAHTTSVRILSGAEVTVGGVVSPSGELQGSRPVSVPDDFCSIHQLQEAALILSGIKAATKDGSGISVKLGSGRVICPGRRGVTGRLLFSGRAQPDPVPG